VLVLIILINIFNNVSIPGCLQLLKRKHQKPLFEALQKIKEGKIIYNIHMILIYIYGGRARAD